MVATAIGRALQQFGIGGPDRRGARCSFLNRRDD
jgi:hypothetical protein